MRTAGRVQKDIGSDAYWRFILVASLGIDDPGVSDGPPGSFGIQRSAGNFDRLTNGPWRHGGFGQVEQPSEAARQ